MKPRLLHTLRTPQSCPQRCPISPRHLPRHRSFQTTTSSYADPPDSKPSNDPKTRSTLGMIAGIFDQQRGNTSPISPQYTSSTDDIDALARMTPSPSQRLPEPHHLHIYAHKHNTHITLARPNHNPLISVSTGNLNFRKAQRGTYDAAYQLGKYVMERIQQQGLLKEIHGLHVVLRDFGPGREALTKVLLGSEGRGLRGKILSVADATRIKFGGTRGRKPRRLG